MKKRLLALFLALVMLAGILTGCNKSEKNSTDEKNNKNDKPSASNLSEPEKATVTAKYAYKATYTDISANFEWVNNMCAANNIMYLSASVMGDEITETDPETGESYSYNEYRDGLFRMDLETGELTELENYATPDIPEGWQGGSNVYAMRVSDDGTLWLLLNVYTYRYNVPEDSEEDTDEKYNYYEEGVNSSVLYHLAADGSTLAQIDLDAGADDDDGYYSQITDFCIDDAGNIYCDDWQNIYVFDPQGTLLFTIDCSENGGGNVSKLGGQVGVSVYFYDEESGASGRRFYPIDLETQDFAEPVKIPRYAYSFYTGDDVYDLYYENNGNIFGYIAETDTSEKVVDWIECDVNSNYINNYTIMNDGSVVAYMNNWSNGENHSQIIKLTRVDADSLPEKTAITLACMYLDWDLREKIVDFNKNSELYRIVVKDYSEYATEEDYNAGLTKLNTEIMSGKVPDIFLSGSIPIDVYAGQGVIADLYQFIDNDEELSRESFVQPLLRAMEKDGKLYELPTQFYIQTAFGLEKVVGEYETWTLDALKDAMTKLQPDATIFFPYSTKSNMLNECIARNISSFVDWTSGTVSFDSQAFIDLLEFANSFRDSFDWETDDYDWSEDNQTRLNSGKQLLIPMAISSFDDYLYQCYGFDGDIKFVGYPSQDGTAGNSFYVSGGFAISAVSACQDAAWAFVREQFLSQKQQVEDGDIWSMPTTQDAFDLMLEKAMTPEYQTDENGEIMYDENGEPLKWPKVTYGSAVSISPDGTETPMEEIEIYELSQHDADTILGLIESTTQLYRYDTDIMEIITDETAAYFAGEKTAEETAALVQSRVNLYVMEQG